MCGIAGRFHYRSLEPVDEHRLHLMTAALAHRGPDGVGHWVDGPIGLGHRRLGGMGQGGGVQPLADAHRQCWVALDGTLHNAPELRAGLEQQGVRFATDSDAELLLKLYASEGPECVSKLRGAFAFALWDGDQRRLMLARDRVGKKPLYFADRGGQLLFASEPKGLLVDQDLPREVDPWALHEFMTYQYVPAPGSIYKGIHKVEPAHYLLIDEEGIRSFRYWELDFTAKRNQSEPELLEELRQLVTDSVRIRMRGDRSIGAFLSGGVDSSLVVALMSQLSGQAVKTFSIGFAEQSFNESGYARQVAERYGTDHQEFTCRPDAISLLPKMVWHFDEPFADSSALPVYYLSEMTRQHVAVALNGDGGDEGFAGYERYLGSRYVQLYSHLPAALRRHLVAPILNLLPQGSQRVSYVRRLRWLNAISLEPPGLRYAGAMTVFRPEESHRLYSDALRADLAGRDPFAHLMTYYTDPRVTDEIDRMVYTDTMTYLPGDLLVKVDRMMMAHGLEGRAPLLDHHVLEFAASLPSEWKLRRGELKYLLKKLASEYLPHDVIYRPKQGFGVPVGQWFRQELAGWLRELLSDSALAQDGYFRQAGIDAFVREHLTGAANHSHRLWALVNLEVWYRMFMRHEDCGGLAPRSGS